MTCAAQRNSATSFAAYRPKPPAYDEAMEHGQSLPDGILGDELSRAAARKLAAAINSQYRIAQEKGRG